MKSDAVVVNGTPAHVFGRLSRPAELETLLHNAVGKARESGREMPADMDEKLANLSFGPDYIEFKGGPTGKVRLRLSDATPDSSVKYIGDGTPVALSIEFDISPEGLDRSFLSVGVRADVPFFLRPMIQGPLRKGLDAFADLLGKIPSWSE